MKKKYLSVALVMALTGSMMMSSCIGSFSLTNKLMDWNNQIGSKFVNELVFIAFWIVPVYEISALADVLVINSIEFWSGENPVDNKDFYAEVAGPFYTSAMHFVNYLENTYTDEMLTNDEDAIIKEEFIQKCKKIRHLCKIFCINALLWCGRQELNPRRNR